MDDWKDKIEAWQRRLADWQREFDARYAELARKQRRWFRKLTAGELEDLAAQARRAAGEELAVELFQFLAELCDAYRAEPLPAPRAKVRAWIGMEPTTLNAAWSFSQQALELTRATDAALTLRRGLAALSIVDVRRDFTAVQELLGRYWIALRAQGIDAAVELAALARISNPGMGGGGADFAQLLREFATSAYFRTHVKPRLSRASA
jgi:hypothetical protein